MCSLTQVVFFLLLKFPRLLQNSKVKKKLRQTKSYMINLIITRLFGIILRSSVTKLFYKVLSLKKPPPLSSLRPSGLTMHTVFTAWMARSLIKVPNLSHPRMVRFHTNIRHFSDSWDYGAKKMMANNSLQKHDKFHVIFAGIEFERL